MDPIKLKMKNFFSHEDSELNFNFKSCLLIGNTEGDYSKSNGSGKSSIFEALLWALFNKSRAPKMCDLVRWGETSAFVELEFSASGEIYRVSRIRNNRNSQSTVNFEIKKGEVWEDASGSTPSLTNKIIEDTVSLDYETFLNTTYFRQNDASEFAEAKPYRRKEILKSIVNITKWDTWEESVKSKIRSIKSKIKILESHVIEVEGLSERLDKESELLSNCKLSIDKMSHNLKIEEDSHVLFLEEYISRKNNLDFNSLGKSESVIKNNEAEIKRLLIKVKSLNETLATANRSVSKVSSSLEKTDSFLSGKRIIDVSSVEVAEIKNSISDLKSDIKFSESKVKDLNLQEMKEGKCGTCGSSVSKETFVSFYETKDNKIVDLVSGISRKRSSLKDLLISLKNLEEISLNNDKISSGIEKRSFSRERLSILTADLNRTNQSIVSFEGEIEVLDEEIDMNKEKIIALSDASYDECKLKLEKKKKLVDSIRDSLFLKKKEVGVHEANIATTEVRLEKLGKVSDELKANRRELEDHTYLKNIMGKNGIQTILLENVIKNHEAIANEVLKEICSEPIRIHLDTQKVSADGNRTLETLDLRIRKDGNILSYNSLSGGEKFRISIALALGLRDLAARFGGANLNLIMLDEVNSPLDRFGVETLFVNVIKNLSQRYKTMVITHDERLKEKFENVIDVCKVNGVSSINYISSE